MTLDDLEWRIKGLSNILKYPYYPRNR